ncbi:MAG: sulfotransferase family protein, partial [archaeon]
EIHLAPWEIKFNSKKIIQTINSENRSVMRLFEYVFDKYAEVQGKKRWFCKDNNLFNYAWEINNFFDDPKFIYLVRDPRDVCLSNIKRSTGVNTAYYFSKLWKKEQEKCIRLFNEQEFKDKIILVKYEKILSKPKESFKKICDFINEPFQEKMLYGKKRKEAKSTDQWKNISKNILKNNRKKYKSRLSKKQIKIIETVLNKEMKYLDYDLDFSDNGYKIGFLQKGFYKIKDVLLRKYKFKFKTKKNEYKIRKKRRELRKNINQRYLID